MDTTTGTTTGHEIDVHLAHAGTIFASCACGWRGPDRLTYGTQARTDAATHRQEAHNAPHSG